jgi:hypothetical protein
MPSPAGSCFYDLSLYYEEKTCYRPLSDKRMRFRCTLFANPVYRRSAQLGISGVEICCEIRHEGIEIDELKLTDRGM